MTAPTALADELGRLLSAYDKHEGPLYAVGNEVAEHRDIILAALRKSPPGGAVAAIWQFRSTDEDPWQECTPLMYKDRGHPHYRSLQFRPLFAAPPQAEQAKERRVGERRQIKTFKRYYDMVMSGAGQRKADRRKQPAEARTERGEQHSPNFDAGYSEGCAAGFAEAEKALTEILQQEVMSKHVNSQSCQAARTAIQKCIDAIRALQPKEGGR